MAQDSQAFQIEAQELEKPYPCALAHELSDRLHYSDGRHADLASRQQGIVFDLVWPCCKFDTCFGAFGNLLGGCVETGDGLPNEFVLPAGFFVLGVERFFRSCLTKHLGLVDK